MRRSRPILVVLAALAGFGSCQTRPAGGTAGAGYVGDDYQAQVDTFNRQAAEQDELAERSVKLLEQQESEVARVTKMLADQEAQNERYEKLLAKWEEQARRMDAVLAAQEKQAGLKPANSN